MVPVVAVVAVWFGVTAWSRSPINPTDGATAAVYALAAPAGWATTEATVACEPFAASCDGRPIGLEWISPPSASSLRLAAHNACVELRASLPAKDGAAAFAVEDCVSASLAASRSGARRVVDSWTDAVGVWVVRSTREAYDSVGTFEPITDPSRLGFRVTVAPA